MAEQEEGRRAIYRERRISRLINKSLSSVTVSMRVEPAGISIGSHAGPQNVLAQAVYGDRSCGISGLSCLYFLTQSGVRRFVLCHLDCASLAGHGSQVKADVCLHWMQCLRLC